MNYICCKPFDGLAIDGRLSIPEGAELTLADGVLIHNGRKVCYPSSANAYAHFSRNDDNHGLERFKLIQDINARIAELRDKRNELIYAEAPNHAEDEDPAEWMSEIPDEAEQFFESMVGSPFLDIFQDGSRRWNKRFYDATVNELKRIKARLP